jgi:hypothetical protein
MTPGKGKPSKMMRRPVNIPPRKVKQPETAEGPPLPREIAGRLPLDAALRRRAEQVMASARERRD